MANPTCDVGPNIIGTIGGIKNNGFDDECSGPFQEGTGDLYDGNVNKTVTQFGTVPFNAQWASSFYGASFTVQPSALRLLSCIKT